MAQAHTVKAQEQEGAWDAAQAWVGWQEIALGRVLVEAVCALVVGQKFLIR